jgi:hypothetical protein
MGEGGDGTQVGRVEKVSLLHGIRCGACAIEDQGIVCEESSLMPVICLIK